MLKNGYYKVEERAFSLTQGVFYNPITRESYTRIIWDIDDVRVEMEHEDEYNEPIDECVRKLWLKRCGVI